MKFLKIKLLASVFLVSFVFAQDESVEEVVVTGSYLKGSATDGASPVEIISKETLDALSPSSVADITANIAVNSGSENNPDSFTQGGTQGTSNVNLRGLGLTSTLVLIDGKRHTVSGAVANDGSVFVNTNMIPVNALERVEILKEGAASVYGSDAVAGVVNYILRKDFKGLELNVSQQKTDLADQTDDKFSLLYGADFANGNLVYSFSQLDRSALPGSANRKLAQTAISGFGNSFLIIPPVPTADVPAYIAANGTTTTVAEGPYAGTYDLYENVPDANCAATGGSIQPQPDTALTETLILEGGSRCGFYYGDRFNLVNDEDHVQHYLAYNTVLDNGVNMSVDYINSVVDVNDNPQSPSYPALSFASPANLIMPGQAGSPFLLPVMWLGRPLGSSFDSPHAPREIEDTRFSLNFSGSYDNGYEWSATYTNSTNDSYGLQPDTSTSRFSAAVAGNGGVSGTESFNLFDPSANSASLIDHIAAAQETSNTAKLSVLDYVVTGSTNGIDFATGVQFKKEEFTVRRNDESITVMDELGNLAVPADLLFLGGGLESDDSRNSFAVFVEAAKDVTDKLELRGALRYEDMDEDSSFNPKVSARYEVNDDLVLRASYSTSFRAPSLVQLSTTRVGLQGVQDFDTDGNPVGNPSFIRVAQGNNDDLGPEESTNINIGAIWTPQENLNVKVDYWSVDYTDVITIENANGKVQADPNGDAIIRTEQGLLIGVTTQYFNAEEVNADGLDIEVTYDFDTPYGMAQVGLNRAEIFSYEIPLFGVTTDVVGLHNHNNFARSLPEVKSVIHGSLKNGDHTLTAFVRMVSDYKTTQAIAAPFAPFGYDNNIDEYTTVDINYSYNLEALNSDMTLSLGVKNAFDEEVPQVYDSVNFSYDPKHHDPRGRMVFLGLKVSL